MKQNTLVLLILVFFITQTFGQNFGVGEPFATSRLQIKGTGNTAATSSLNATNSLGNSLLFVRNDGNIGIDTIAPSEGLHIAGRNFAVTNTIGSGQPLSLSGAGIKMFFYSQKAAFRSGYVDDDQWNAANIGPYSIATGYNTKANGYYSTAFGFGTVASTNYSTAMGYNTTANGSAATAMGNGTTATGQSATAMGRSSVASGQISTAMGENVYATSFREVSLGSFNTTVLGATPTSWVTTDRLFTIGNGTDVNNKSDALVMLKNGNTTLKGALTLTNGTSSFTLPQVDGTAGQVLTTDGSGAVSWGSASAGASYTAGTGIAIANGVISNTGDLSATNELELPAQTGNTGKYLTTDGTNVSWGTVSGSGTSLNGAYNEGGAGAGRTITANNGAVLVNGTDGLQVTGTFGNGTTLALAGGGERMFFYPKKAAFRAGSVIGTEWDDINIGTGSTATGTFTTASGENAVAMGTFTTASGSASIAIGDAATAISYGSVAIGTGVMANGESSTAMGSATTTNGNYATAMGHFTNANGYASTALGDSTIASGVFSTALGDSTTSNGLSSTAMGSGTTASGTASIAMGANTIANGNYATAMGKTTIASEYASTAMGNHTTANGETSTAMGDFTTAQAYNETTIGSYNTEAASYDATMWVPTDRLFTIGNGTGATTLSDALVMLKNGNTTLKGALTLTNGTSSFTLPQVDGTAGQVLTTNGSGAVSWGTAAGGGGSLNTAYNFGGAGAGRTITADNGAVLVDGTDGLQVTGTYNNGTSLALSGAGTRMFFYPKKAAFRVGRVTSTQWDNDSIGNYSIAMGHNTKATGDYSTVMGKNTVASGDYSIAMGTNNISSGLASTTMGVNTIASGSSATSMGANTTAIGDYSTVMGFGTKTNSFGETVIGLHNTNASSQNATMRIITDRLFTIGNGSGPADKSDALVMLKNGNTTLNGALTLSNGTSSFTLPQVDGTAGQVLTTNGSGAVSWGTAAGGGGSLNTAYNSGGVGVGRTITADNGAVLVDGTDGLQVTGTAGGGAALALSGAGTRMFYYPKKAAFRAGGVGGTEWDEANIGYYSVAMGATTKASANFSTAMGVNTTANGNSSIAMGEGTTTAAFGETTIGIYNTNATAQDATNWVTTDRLFTIGNGTNLSNQSDALVMLKNGSTTLKGALTLTDGTSSFTLPQADGTAGQVLTTDGSGVVSWGTAAGGGGSLNTAYNFGGVGAGRTITADNGAVLVDGADGFQVTGTWGSGATLALSGAGTRMFFYPQKAAFRAGGVTGTEWDNSNIGNYSTAFGSNTIANGNGAVCMGVNSTASGLISISIGQDVTTLGNNSIGIGKSLLANGVGAIALGRNITTSGNYCIAIGNDVTSNSLKSIGIGQSLVTNSYSEIVIGTHNTIPASSNATAWVSTDRLFTIGNGQNSNLQSDALVMLKNGNTTLKGALTLTDGTSSFTLPQADGTAGQVLTTDGSGVVSWGTAAAGGGSLNDAYNSGGVGAGRTITADNGALLVNGTDGFQVTGTSGAGANLTLSGAGTRMFFYPKKAAFRAGEVAGVEWNNDSIGYYSIAMGGAVTASGDGSVAMGMGTKANREYSIAMGGFSTASGNKSTSIGYLTTASGNSAVAMGSSTIASGMHSFATGLSTNASGKHSTAMGQITSADAYTETTIGLFNTSAVNPNPNSWIATDRLFTIGNGTGYTTRSDALVMLKDGSTTFSGNVTGPSFTTPSDKRFKNNIISLANVSGSALMNLENIGSYYYNYKVEEFPKRQFPKDRQIGFIAQEIEAIYPELVITDEQGYKKVDYAKITPVLVEAIKELKAENDALKAKNAHLEANDSEIKAKIEALENAVYGNAKR